MGDKRNRRPKKQPAASGRRAPSARTVKPTYKVIGQKTATLDTDSEENSPQSSAPQSSDDSNDSLVISLRQAAKESEMIMADSDSEDGDSEGDERRDDDNIAASKRGRPPKKSTFCELLHD